jgi:thioredoxin-related protein
MHKLLLLALLMGFTPLLIAANTSQPTSGTLQQEGIAGETPLMKAVRVNDVVQVSALINAGVNINKRNAGGQTALMLAAAGGRADIVKLLLKAGARPDINDYEGFSAADRAAQNGFDLLASQLKARIVKVKKHDKNLGYDFSDDAYVDISLPGWFKQSFLDLREDQEEALAAGKQGILLFISTRRCSYCKAFLDTVFADPAIRRRVQSNYDVIGFEIFSDFEMVDVDGQIYRVNEFVSKVKAAFTPTLIFYDKEGQRVLKIVGYYPRDKFRRVLDYLEGEVYRKELLRDYLKRTEPSSPAKAKGMIVDRDLFSSPPHILDRRAARAQQQMFVVFERGNCESCQRLHQNVFSDDAIRKLIGQFEAIQLDISDNSTRIITPAGERISASQWYQNLKLSYSPAIVFFDEAGLEVMRLDSETLRYRLEGTLQLVLEKAYQKDAQLQRWRRTKAIEALGKK